MLARLLIAFECFTQISQWNADAYVRRGIVHSASDFNQCLRTVYQGQASSIQLANCDKSDPNQMVEIDNITALESAYGYLKFANPELCLSLNGWSSDEKTSVLTWECSSQTNQQWMAIGSTEFLTLRLCVCLYLRCTMRGYINDSRKFPGRLVRYQNTTLICITVPTPLPFNTNNSIFQLQMNFGGLYLTSDLSSENFLYMSSLSQTSTQGWIIEPLDTPIQIIVSGSTGSCFRSKHDNSVDVEMTGCNWNDNAQLVMQTSFGLRKRIRMVANGKCLDTVSDSSSCYGFQNTCQQVLSQQWTVKQSANTHSMLGIGDWCFRYDGRALTFIKCYARDVNQEFHFTSLPAVQHYNVLLRNPQNFCIQLQELSENGSELEVAPCDPSLRTQYISPISPSLGQIPAYVQFSGMCLSLGDTDANGRTHVVSWTCLGQTNQQWNLLSVEGLNFKLQSASSGLCVTGQTALNYMYTWDCNDVDDSLYQVWNTISYATN